MIRVLLPALLALAPAAQARTFTGENPLGVPTDLMQQSQDGLELVYQREYKAALDAFRAIDETWPASPVGPLGRSLVWQARMLENYDFRFEDAYYYERDRALKRLERSGKDPSLKAWNLFLAGGVVGLEGVQLARKGEFLSALNKGWDALSALKKARRVEPDFHDPDLGLGIYYYWRTVFTRSVKYLPFFGDKREEGMALIFKARDNALLVWASAGLTLTYAYMEEREWAKALAEVDSLLEEYPNSVIGLTMRGRVLKAQKRYQEAAAAFEQCRTIDPENTYSVLLLGETWYASKRHNKRAEGFYTEFLAMANQAPKDQHGLAEYRLGMLARRFDYVDEAIEHLQRALVLRPQWDAATRRLSEMQARKAKGLGKTRPEVKEKGLLPSALTDEKNTAR